MYFTNDITENYISSVEKKWNPINTTSQVHEWWISEEKNQECAATGIRSLSPLSFVYTLHFHGSIKEKKPGLFLWHDCPILSILCKKITRTPKNVMERTFWAFHFGTESSYNIFFWNPISGCREIARKQKADRRTTPKHISLSIPSVGYISTTYKENTLNWISYIKNPTFATF